MSQKNTKVANTSKGVDSNPTKPEKDDDDDIYGIAFSDDEEYEQDPNTAYAGVTQSGTSNVNITAELEAEALKKQQEAAYKASTTDVEWDTFEVFFNEVIDLERNYVTESNKGSSLKCADKGRITLSVFDGSLQLGFRSNDADFRTKTVELPEGSKLKKKAEATPLDSDIVQSIYLEGFKAEGWNDNIVLHMNTVPKFKTEGHFGKSVNVNQLIMPHEWAKPNHRIKIADRTINNGQMDFQKKYPGCSPENLARTIQKNTANTYLVELNSPIISVINAKKGAHVEGGEYKLATIAETNQVLVTKAVIKQFMPQTLRSMSYGISYGNVTNNRLAISFEAPIPHHLLAKHEEWSLCNATGRQFMGFADPYKTNPLCLKTLNASNKIKSELFQDASKSIRLTGKLIFKYLRSTKTKA